MNRVNLLISKVDELREAKEAVLRIERELGELVGDEVAPARPAGKMPVAGAAPSAAAILDAVEPIFAKPEKAKAPAQKDFPPEGVESLPIKLVRIVNENPERTFTPRQMAEFLGEDFRKTHASLLHRAARKGLIGKRSAGVFGALPVRAKANGRKGKRRAS